MFLGEVSDGLDRRDVSPLLQSDKHLVPEPISPLMNEFIGATVCQRSAGPSFNQGVGGSIPALVDLEQDA